MSVAAKDQSTAQKSARWALSFGIAGGILAALAVLFFCDPSQTALYPVCWFYQLTGLACPGCGALRALHQLFHGHLTEAFRLNPVLILALPFLFWVLARIAARELAGMNLPRLAIGRVGLLALLALAVGFWILRNLPLAPFSWFAL